MDAHANGVGFYSLKLVGVCRYLWNVDEVSSSRFLLYKNIDNYDIHKTNYYERILPDRQQSDSYGS